MDPQYQGSGGSSIPKINVVIRKRPLSQKELASSDTDITEVRDAAVIIREMKHKVDMTKYVEEHVFNFDDVFDENDDNQIVTIYERTVKPLVEFAFEKGTVTCFAYGQTGSGKTYTMIGNSKVEGLYIKAGKDIFTKLEEPEFASMGILVSYFEIYCGKLYDLLNNKKLLHARVDAKQRVNIVGLKQYKVDSVQSLMQAIDFGNVNRMTGVTGMNNDSSRSHAVLQISIVSGRKTHGKVSFIDLAGNERGADTYDQDKQTRMDGAEINKSLLALKECIRALDQDKRHTPFRGSKLTMVLKDSFVGKSKTVMIGNIAPSFSCCEHTLNTLRYADRVKELKKEGGSGQRKISSEDSLAKQLMLPRQHTQTNKYDIRGGVLKDTTQNKTKKKRTVSPIPKSSNTRMNNYMEVSEDQRKSAPRSYTPVEHKLPQKMTQQGFFEGGQRLKPLIKEPDTEPSIGHDPSFRRGKENLESGKAVILGDNVDLSTMDNDELNNLHERLINVILSEEENLITSHRTHVDKMCDYSRNELGLLKEVEKAGSDIEYYIESLQSMLTQKKQSILVLQERLDKFKKHLREEESLSLYCSERQFPDDN